MYCENCWMKSYCTGPCKNLLNYLGVISECLNGHPFGEDNFCDKCADKGLFCCPKFGPEAETFERFREEIDGADED